MLSEFTVAVEAAFRKYVVKWFDALDSYQRKSIELRDLELLEGTVPLSTYKK